MEKTFRLTVITPDGTVLDTAVTYANLPAKGGTVGILPGHAPMVCALEKGSLRYKTVSETLTFPLTGGIAEVRDNKVTVIQ